MKLACGWARKRSRQAAARSGGSSTGAGSALKKIVHASEQERADVAEARQRWKEDQPALDPARLVFIDETGTSTNMARLRGRCRRGERLVGRVPHGHWKITTFIAGLRCDAVTAPFVIDRPMNGLIFRTYLEHCLIPTLTPGDIVIMDNLPAHKVAGVREIIEAVGARLVSCRPTRPTSTRSNNSSPSSKPCCERPPRDQSTPCGTGSANSSMPSAPKNVATTSATQDMRQLEWNLL